MQPHALTMIFVVLNSIFNSEADDPANQVRAGALGGDLRVYQQFTVKTPDANSFRAAQSHIMADAHKQALAAARKS
jgi:hypothetical protein